MKKVLILILLISTTFAFAEETVNKRYIGETPPAFSFVTFANTVLPVNGLAEFRGDVVLLEFFRTACPGCRMVMDKFERSQKKYNRPDFFVATTTNDSKNLIQRFLYFEGEGLRINYPIAIRSRSTFQLRKLPMAYVIGRDGKVVWADNPNSSYDKALAEAIAKADPAMPKTPKRMSKTWKHVIEEKYSNALKDCEKAKDKPEAAEFVQYIEERIEKYYTRYIDQVDAYIEVTDIYNATVLLSATGKKFKGTKYENEITAKLNPLLKEEGGEKLCKAWSEYWSIANSARTGKKSNRVAAIKKLNKLIEDYKDCEQLIAEAKNLIEVLNKPWNIDDAAVMGGGMGLENR